jgi:ParB family chromosome partitioning protein
VLRRGFVSKLEEWIVGGNKGQRSDLASLIQGAEGEQSPGAARILQIPIEEIRPNRQQPRKSFDPDRLSDLVASIRANGIIQPVLVRAIEGGYELIAGERRYRAAGLAGLRTVPAIMRTVDHQGDALELALIENLQREDLNPIEEAEALRVLMEQHSYTQEKLSRKLGRARATLANSLRLLRLPLELQDAISSGAISAGHGKALLAVQDADVARELLQLILERQLNVRQTEQAVRRATATSDDEAPRRPAAPDRSPQLTALADRLSRTLQTKVSLSPRATGGGRISVDYSDGEDLERIVGIVERMF